MLPAKIGEGVFGSNSGGVKPTGASSLVGASAAFPSAAAALIVRCATDNLSGLGLIKDKVGDCFHGTVTRSPDFEAERLGVKREAWVAMAMKRLEIRREDWCQA